MEDTTATTIGERLGQLPALLSAHLGVRLSASAFAESVSVTPQSLHGYARQGKMPPASAVAGVLRSHPSVSLRWLLLGEGSPIGTTGDDLLSTILRVGAERGVDFDRLNVVTTPEGIRFDAAGLMRAE